MSDAAHDRHDHGDHDHGHHRHHRGPRPARVEVAGTGTASAAPDVVRVSIGIRVDGDGVATALGSANAAVRAVTSAARDHGLADRDLASTSASVQPRWNRDGTKVIGYTAYHQLALLVRSLGNLNDVIDAVAAAAGDNLVIDGISLELADQGPLAEQARAAAFADAQAKARQYAALSGLRLGRVLGVIEGAPAFGGPRPMGKMRMMAAMADSAGGMPVEAGEHSVSAGIQVAWELLAADEESGAN